MYMQLIVSKEPALTVLISLFLESLEKRNLIKLQIVIPSTSLKLLNFFQMSIYSLAYIVYN